MTAWALVVTTSAIDGGPESRTVHHRIFYDIKNPYHYSLFTIHYSLLPFFRSVINPAVDEWQDGKLVLL